MKKILTLATAFAALLAFSSCDNRPNPSGVWTGTFTEKLPGVQDTEEVTLTFDQTGAVQANYDITLVEDLNGNDSIVSPFQARIMTSVSQSGDWQYVDGEDDEILLKFDKNSLKVDISPDKVEYRVDGLTGEMDSQLEALTPKFIAKYTQFITDQFSKDATILLDDVKVSKNMLKVEINKVDYIFTGSRTK